MESHGVLRTTSAAPRYCARGYSWLRGEESNLVLSGYEPDGLPVAYTRNGQRKSPAQLLGGALETLTHSVRLERILRSRQAKSRKFAL